MRAGQGGLGVHCLRLWTCRGSRILNVATRTVPHVPLPPAHTCMRSCTCAGEGDDKYLIATCEQTLCAMHRKGWFERQDLPVKWVQ